MSKTKLLPMGIENFKRMRTDNFYYIDKTGFVTDLLNNIAYVNLFTRPRRFGKTLNMSMLRYFLEIDCDIKPFNNDMPCANNTQPNSTLFDGLAISGEKELCEKYMGRFPVISITLKGATGKTFTKAEALLRRIIADEAMHFQFLSQSKKLTEEERKQYKALISTDQTGAYNMPDELLENSLKILSQLLQKHYGQNVVMLIDEYDVPLDYAYRLGYYEDMVDLIRVLFGNAFKTNDSLQFAVLTGCLRVSKESIFTGLNNFKVYTINDMLCKEAFGFTDKEIRELLSYYGFQQHYDAIREWYDGYQFGGQHIYCPWDVINYCADLRSGNTTKPRNYWVNTSSNDIIRQFVDKAKSSTRNEIEILIEGGSIKKQIRQDLTYRDIYSSIDNLWSLLFTTGYLTQCGQDKNAMTASGGYEDDGTDSDITELIIPNREIRWIFIEQIREWFKEEIAKNSSQLESFCKAFEENDIPAIEEGFHAYLKKTISIRDTNTRKNMKENFYHGILLGIFGNMDGWDVRSNAESGEGYSDITVEIEDREIGIVIELKYAENAAFDDACKAAAQQIRDRNYEETLVDDGMKTIYCYGIACYKKRCRVISVSSFCDYAAKGIRCKQ